MKSIFTTLLVLISIMITAQSTPDDTLNLFRFRELVFHSDLEKSSLEYYHTGGSYDYFSIAMATDPSADLAQTLQYKSGFYQFLAKVKTHRKFSAKPKGQINHIFKAIHDEYFRLYQQAPLFSEIFTHGHFNCLTATALYAMAFEHYGIPYQIILQPEHVYLVAYPQASGIVVETTNPLKGTRLSIDNREKTKSVQALVSQKIVTQQEVNQKGVEQVFNDIYLSKETPDLKQLMGSLYYNIAALEGQDLNYLPAYENYKKSSFIYPRRITTAQLISHSTLFVAQNEYTNPDTYRILCEMEKFITHGITPNMLYEQGIRMINTAREAGNTNLADSAYVWMMNGFSDIWIKNELSYAYHYNKSLQLLKSYRYDKALEMLEVAYHLKPDNVDAGFIMMELIMHQIRQAPIHDAFQQLVSLAGRVEPLNNNKKFTELLQSIYLELFFEYLMDPNYDQAEKIRAEFEERYKPGAVESPQIIRMLEQIYSQASVIYYKERRRTQARNLIISGLNYVPESFELQSKMDALK